MSPKVKTRNRSNASEYAEEAYRAAATSLEHYRLHNSLRGKMVLDAGCGLGGKTVYYSEMACKYVAGVDMDPTHIRHATDFATSKGALKLGFLVADLSALPFPPSTFDVIILSDVVEHIRRPILKDTFTECSRLVRPDGKIYLQFPPWSCYNASHLFDYISVPWAHLIFSEETLINVTKKYDPQPRIGELSYTEHFRQLNRIGVSEFLDIVTECDLAVNRLERRMIKNINALRYLPVLRKYLTTRILAVLSPA